MSRLGLYIATWTLFCSCSAAPDIHLQMSPTQLQQVFHVDEVNQVPNYELIKLTHLSTAHHVRKKRSIDTASNSFSSSGSKYSNNNNNNLVSNHHVKKDLSKVPIDDKLNSIFGAEIKKEKIYETSKSRSKYSGLQISSSSSTTTTTEKVITTDDQQKISFDENEKIKISDLISLSDIKEHKVSFDAFGETLNLTLKPTEGLFKEGPQSLKMWHAHPDPTATDGINYEEIRQDGDDTSNDENVGEIFQDQDNMAAILMRKHEETGDLLMEGSIGHELIIKPLPKELSQSEDGGVHHIVYKRASTEEFDKYSDYAFMEPDHLGKRYRRKRSLNNLTETENIEEHSRSKRAIPHIIYPEILVIVDYDGYRLHGGDNVQVKRYFVAFWNGVDLRYRLLKGPKIRISIAGIIISRGRDATPYLERNRVGRDAIDSAAALTDMGKYLFRERRLPVYDIAVAITKLDMCRRQYANDACNRGTAGFAYVGGACVVNKRLEKVNSVAIIEDTGGFSGIIVAAHEVGHLLGAVHDGSPPPSYLGGPGAEKCRWEDGYIMSDLRHTDRGFRWSPCSVQSFHHFLNGDTASCLHNAPHEDEALGRALPGTLLSLDAQCRRDRGTSACFKDERVCAQLFCFDSASGYCVAYRPAAEGSSCGDGQHCMDGRCVAEHENIIPDYSQHTPSYASPNAYNSQNIKHGLYSYKDENDEDRYTTAAATTSTTTTPRTTITTVQAPTSQSTTTTPTSTTSSTVKANYFNNAYHNTFQKFGEPTTRSPFKFSWSNTKSTTTRAPFSTKFAFHKTTTVSPYDWLYYKTKTPASRSLDVGNANAKNPSQTISTRSPYANIKPSTYKSVFDVYFNQIASYKKKNNL